MRPVEEGAFDAQLLLAESRAGRFVEAIVVTRVAYGRGIHGRQLELPFEVFLDQRVERRVGRIFRRRGRTARQRGYRGGQQNCSLFHAWMVSGAKRC